MTVTGEKLRGVLRVVPVTATIEPCITASQAGRVVKAEAVAGSLGDARWLRSGGGSVKRTLAQRSVPLVGSAPRAGATAWSEMRRRMERPTSALA